MGGLFLANRTVFLIGYGPGASRKTKLLADVLRLRAIVLEDDAGTKVALLSGDLWAGSSRVLMHVGSILREEHAGLGFDDARVFFSGTHTHSSIGEIYESPYYSAFASSWPSDAGFDDELATKVARQLVEVIVSADGKLAPATLAVGEATFAGNSINRSYPAFVRNHVPGTDPDPDAGEASQRAVINPKLKLLRLSRADSGKPIGVWGAVNCHATALGRNITHCHPDFLGTASRMLEGDSGVPWVLCAGAEGDVDPQPAGMTRQQFLDDRASGTTLSFKHLDTLAQALESSVQQTQWGAEQASVKLTALRTYALASKAAVQGGRLPTHPMVGDPVLSGSELGRGPCSEEGARDEGQAESPQKPKVALNPATLVINGHMKQHAPYLPLSVFKLGDALWLVGLPGEPTTRLAHSVEEKLAAHANGAPVMVCGVTGGYNGYFVTEAEYGAQHYEGASCIWGRYTQRFILERLEALVKPAPVLESVRAGARRGPTERQRFARTLETSVKRAKTMKPREGLSKLGLVEVKRRAPSWNAELEVELGPHLIRVRTLDHRPAGKKNTWQLVFLVDRRLLEYRARIVRPDGAPLSGWKALKASSS